MDGADDIGRVGFDPELRELCPDGSCIGVLGPDGRCKECGVAGPLGALDPRTQGLRTEEEVAPEVEAHVVAHSLPAEPEDFEERELCSDGGCIGLIGGDGCCRECGQPAAPRGAL